MRVADVVEILMHWHAGRRMGELCSSLKVDPKTVRKYLAPAITAGLAPGRSAFFTAIAFSSNDRLVAGDCNGGVRIWDPVTRTLEMQTNDGGGVSLSTTTCWRTISSVKVALM